MKKIYQELETLALLTLLSGAIGACENQNTSLPAPTSTLPSSTATLPSVPAASEPRTLMYCTNFDPESLYLYAETSSLMQSEVLQAIYDGPIDNQGFKYQPVILETLPSLADGDAQLQPVAVSAGEQVVDDSGSPVTLEAGVRVHPSGCQSDDCALDYDGDSELQMDQLSATFQLLPGLAWSDGVPLTAADSVYSYKLAADPATPGVYETKKAVIKRTASYTALDDLHVAWVGLPGYLDATYPTNFWSPLPQHLWGGLSAAELLEADVSNQKPVGWGPYVIQERVPGESITLSRNEHYFRTDEGLPRFDRLVFRFVGDDANANLERLLSGECDVVSRQAMATDVEPELNEQLAELDAEGQIHASFTTSTRFEHLDFGIQPQSYDDGWQPGDRPDFFGDVRTRRAFALCMDRQRMAEAATAQRLDTYVSPQHPLYNSEVRKFEFDVAAGSALLEEAGWMMGADGVRVYAGENPHIPTGTRLSVQDDALDDVNLEAVDIMVDSLAECGIEMKVKYWENTELFAPGADGIVFGRNFELAQFRWLTGATPPCDLYLSEQIPGEDPQLFPLGWEGQNDPGFQDTPYDQACLAALQSLPDQPGYAENHLKAQQIFAEQLPVVPLFLTPYTAATRPDFCGQILDPSENTSTWNIESFDYGPGC
jgi:peptide/nickel transport system substrate-binding protein